MYELAYQRLCDMAKQPQALERSIEYLYRNISPFLKKNERVLICFGSNPGSFGHIMAQAVLRCEAVPVFPGDLRWKTLLRECFLKHCTALVGTPLMVLGLSKLAKRMETPLYTRNVILAGYPAAKWMIDGICSGLDCRIWGVFDPSLGSVIAGFSCLEKGMVHLRSDEYGVDILDEKGEPLGEGEYGEIVLYSAADPSVRFPIGDYGRIITKPCPCGCEGIRITDFDTVRKIDTELSQLGAQLHKWTSILDCRLARSEYGLELEIITFPGEKLPKLPSCAKLSIRNWDPETDEPFRHMNHLKNRHFSSDNG